MAKYLLAEVEEVLAHPDNTELLPSGRVNAFKKISKKLIRVSYVEEKGRIIVISVVDKNK